MTITKSVTGMNTIINLHHANKALTEVHNLYSEDLRIYCMLPRSHLLNSAVVIFAFYFEGEGRITPKILQLVWSELVISDFDVVRKEAENLTFV